MENIIQQISDKSISEANHRIDKIIEWQLDSVYSLWSKSEGDDFEELKLKIKQQILFTLIKKVTK